MMDISYMALRIPAILVAITFHEFAHARVALAFGDETAARAGRITLNPLAHLDPIGTIGFVLGGFGWGRPVPVDSGSLRHPRADLWISAAGPLSNLAIAVIAAIALRILGVMAPGALTADGFLAPFLYVLIHLNLVLCFFNFLPIFPLDGSHMATNLLPLETAYAFRRFNESYGMMILLGLILISLRSPVSPLGILVGTPVAWCTKLLL